MPEPKPQAISSRQNTGMGVLTRLGWLFFGNVAVLICAISIANHRGSFFSGADVAFWVVSVALAIFRYIDISRFDGVTATGQPTTMAHWWRYVLLLAVLSLCLWGVVHAIAHFSK